MSEPSRDAPLVPRAVLTGVDYFSTLGYQPGIALLAAGALSPIATALLVAVTLLGALPVYAQVAAHSYAGLGSIAMLEHLLSGWRAKVFVLVLLGFAATDFVITITLSAADAAQHALKNPYLHPWLGGARVSVTIALLFLLALVFLRGFRDAIGLAAAVAIPYLVLNAVVLVRSPIEIAHHMELISNWRVGLAARGDWTALLLASAVIFPKLALGMSGFETGVSVMPLVSAASEPDAAIPRSRIVATRKLLTVAASLMSLMLLASSFATLLIPEQEYRIGGPASGRAIAYLAHRLLGSAFGSAYDFATIAILWFAGASAMAGRPAEPRAPVLATLWHGSAVGGLSPAPGPGPVWHRRCDHAVLRRARRGPGRGVRDRRAGSDPVGSHSGCPGVVDVDRCVPEDRL